MLPSTLDRPANTAPGASRSRHAQGDAACLAQRQTRGDVETAISIYEVDLDTWRRPAERAPNFRELALPLADYVRESAFTHVALPRVGEAPAERAVGNLAPDDFSFLVDTLHQAGIGVIVDGLADDARVDFDSLPTRALLRSKLLSWLVYPIDGLRFAALDRLLYLDYGRRPGEWQANRHGGKENLDAVDFLRKLNAKLARDHPDVFTIAAGVSGWPMVSAPVQQGGLGFSMVESSAWAGATLSYFRNDPWFRKFHHEQLSESVARSFAENLILPLTLATTDQAAGQRFLLEQLPGDAGQRYAGLRSLYGYMWAHPGKKLLRMGAELAVLGGQPAGAAGEADEFAWARRSSPEAGGLRRWVGDLNRFYRAQAALHELDFDAAGLRWIEAQDRDNSVLSFLRCARDGSAVLVVCNFTPVLRTSYVVGVPGHALWREALNSEAVIYGGSGAGNFGHAETMPVPAHGQPMSLALTLPPHGVLFFVPDEYARLPG